MSLFKFNWGKKASQTLDTISSTSTAISNTNAGMATTLKNSMGEQGYKYITGAGSYSAAPMNCIYAIADTVVSTTASVGDSITTVTIPAGTALPGKYTSVTQASGSAFYYLE